MAGALEQNWLIRVVVAEIDYSFRPLRNLTLLVDGFNPPPWTIFSALLRQFVDQSLTFVPFTSLHPVTFLK
jgi:hypothetical protein